MANICDNLLVVVGPTDQVEACVAQALAIPDTSTATVIVSSMFSCDLSVAQLRFDTRWEPAEDVVTILSADSLDIDLLLFWSEPGLLGVGLTHVRRTRVATSSLPVQTELHEPVTLPVVCIRTAAGDMTFNGELACIELTANVADAGLPMARPEFANSTLTAATRDAIALSLREWPIARHGVGIDLSLAAPVSEGSPVFERLDGGELADVIVCGGYGRRWDELDVLGGNEWVRPLLLEHASRFAKCAHRSELLSLILASMFEIDVNEALEICASLSLVDLQAAAALLDRFEDLDVSPHEMVAVVAETLSPVS